MLEAKKIYTYINKSNGKRKLYLDFIDERKKNRTIDITSCLEEFNAREN